MILNYRHTGLVVNDLKLQLKFYTEILGLAIIKRQKENISLIRTILNNQTGLKTVKLGQKGKIFLELLKFNDNTRIQNRPIHAKGFTHIAFGVDDLLTLWNKLLCNHVQILSPPTLSYDKKYEVLFCRDFENNFIELVQQVKKTDT